MPTIEETLEYVANWINHNIPGVTDFNEWKLEFFFHADRPPIKNQLRDILKITPTQVPDHDLRMTICGALLMRRILCFDTIQTCRSIKPKMINDANSLSPMLKKRPYAYFTKTEKDMLKYYPRHRAYHKFYDEITRRLGGTPIKYYVQGMDPGILAQTNTHQGWCLGASIQWLKCKKENATFWTEEGRIREEHHQAIRARMSLQTFALSDTNKRNRWHPAMKSFSSFDHEVTHEGYDTAVTMLTNSIWENTPQTYVLINFWFYMIPAAHAMAMYIQDSGNVFFMDPNLGEFKFTNKNVFTDWFIEFTRFMRYDISKFYLSYYRHRP